MSSSVHSQRPATALVSMNTTRPSQNDKTFSHLLRLDQGRKTGGHKKGSSSRDGSTDSSVPVTHSKAAVGRSYFVLNSRHKLKTRLNLNQLEPLLPVFYTQLSEEKDK